jgi:hypothetical protein
LKVRRAEAIEALGHPHAAVDASVVIVTGPAYVFGSDIQLRYPDEKVAYGYLKEQLPAWYFISAEAGTAYGLRFGRPGIVVLLSSAGSPTSGLKLVAQTPALNVGSSRAVTLSCADRPTCVLASQTGDKTWYTNEPTIGLPGCLLAQGHKLSTVQGVAGINASTAIAPPSAIYVDLVYQSPSAGLMAGQTPTPAYFFFRATGLTGTGGLGCDTDLVKVGDLSALDNPVSLILNINHPVSEVGIFFPALENESAVGSGIYSRIDFSIYSLLGAKTTPTSGGGTDVPIGVIRPTIPGIGFGFADVRSST